MSATPLLSICIPTYNRAALLEEALSSILRQVGGCAGEVEIVISDNASTDSTSQTVAAVSKAYPEAVIRYARQPANVGADANIYAVLQQGTGEFLLALSDDDLLLEGAVPRLRETLRQNPSLDAIRLNTGSFLTDSRTLRVLSSQAQEDQILTDPNATLMLVGSGFTFLSAFVFRRTLISGKDYTPRIGSNILQAYLFLDAVAAAGQTLIIAHPLVGVRENNSGGYNQFQVFVTNFLAALEYAAQNGYTRAAVRATRVSHLRAMLFPLIRSARMNTVTTEGVACPDFRDAARRMLKAYGLDPFLLFVVLPLLLLPTHLLHGSRDFYKRLALRRHHA